MQVNGVPSCSNSFFLQTLLRDTWGYDEQNGWVSSDCDAVYNVYDPHMYAANQTGAAADSLRAGTDIDCGTTYPYFLVPAFDEGFVSRDDIELALIRLYTGLIDQGYFEGNGSLYRDLTWDDVVKTDSWNISYEAAVEGIVLLKNDGTLPLSKSIKSVALIGPWANATTQMQGNYYDAPPYFISPLAALEASNLTVNFALGTLINSNSTANFSAALAAASKSDAIIFAGGIDNTIEAEGIDRENITWPGNQLELIAELAGCGKPLVVLQMGAGQVDGTSLKANDNVNSIIWVGFPYLLMCVQLLIFFRAVILASQEEQLFSILSLDRALLPVVSSVRSTPPTTWTSSINSTWAWRLMLALAIRGRRMLGTPARLSTPSAMACSTPLSRRNRPWPLQLLATATAPPATTSRTSSRTRTWDTATPSKFPC